MSAGFEVWIGREELSGARSAHGHRAAEFALEHGAGRSLARFEFRGITPLFAARPFSLEGRPAQDGSLALWARGADGELAMSATAEFH